MFRIASFAAVCCIAFAGSGHQLSASANTKAEEARALIEEYADALCGPLFEEGSNTKVSVDGDARVLSNWLLQRLFGLGFSAAAQVQTETYVGPRREDLLAENSDIRQCRQTVREDLLHLFGIAKAGPSDEAKGIDVDNSGQIQTGDKSPVMIGIDGPATVTYGD